MKRLLTFGLSLGLVSALAVPAIAVEKVPVCHLNDSAEQGAITGGAGNVFYFGRVIMVAPAALPDHLSHGDAISDPVISGGGYDSPYPFITPETIRLKDDVYPWESLNANAELNGIDLGNTNCAFREIVPS